MAHYIATLAPGRAHNWQVCKDAGLWGVVGRGTNWLSNGRRVVAGDRLFIWQGGKPNGFIAQVEALGPMTLTDDPGVQVPWEDPSWFGGVIPIRVIAELPVPAGDKFPNANGRVGERFGFNNTVLQHILEEIPAATAQRIEPLFEQSFDEGVGIPYHSAPPVLPDGEQTPFEVDPDKVGRGVLAHFATVEALAGWVATQGLEPLLPRPEDPRFDLAWYEGETLNVAEVKSTTSDNREMQLRLGLGQVLRYRYHLRARAQQVQAWLVAEVPVPDPTWPETCSTVDVLLTWPDALASFGTGQALGAAR